MSSLHACHHPEFFIENKKSPSSKQRVGGRWIGNFFIPHKRTYMLWLIRKKR